MTGPEAALTARDVRTLERAIRRYQALGLEASLGINREAYGQAAIWHVDSRDPKADTYQLDIDKRWGDYGRVIWNIGIARSNGLTLKMKSVGQVTSNILLFAMTKAELLVAEKSAGALEDRTEAADDAVKIDRSEFASLSKIAVVMSESLGAKAALSRRASMIPARESVADFPAAWRRPSPRHRVSA